MSASVHHILLLSLIFLIINSSFSQSDPRQILLKFKKNLAGSNTQVFTNWNAINPVCNFTGIICNNVSSVKEINLPQQQLIGTLDFDSICSIESLERISLESNHLHGNVTSHLSNCKNLHFLDLGENSFSGEFPWKSLQELTNLTFLSLGGNPFEKTQFPSEILNLFKLQTLYLGNCGIEGRIPEEIENLLQLRILVLSNNSLIGEIPEVITNLTNLETLELYCNQMSGIFPNGFRNLVMLSQLDVSNNSFEGNLTELRNMTRLESLQLFENKFSGGIPVEFGEFKLLKEFSIYRNMFTGELPAKIGSWAKFAFIDASENFLSGPIPRDMCKHGNMDALLMLKNQFTGGLPETYANCSSLLRLRLSENSLSGRIPDGIWSLPNLDMIDLDMNNFEGQVPSEISKAESLSQIKLAYNQFSGEIPVRIGDLKKLNRIRFEGNFFSGSIPETLGSCVSLFEINLAGNSFSGSIPASLGSLPALSSLNLSSNKLSGAIPTSFSALTYSLIDVSNNMLIGRVPGSLSAESYRGSFAGNPGLCGDRIKGLDKCPPATHGFGGLGVRNVCLIAIVVFLLVLGIAWLVVGKLRQKDCTDLTKNSSSREMSRFQAGDFTEDEILNSINEENLIGHGSSGKVYKVELRSGMKFAVKQMCKSRTGIRRREFDAEVAILSSVIHTNVVKLYCSITSEDFDHLVYEYVPNGSLWDRLHTDQTTVMDWILRYKIAVGIAYGLRHLHDDCIPRLIHRDVKSSNILLDAQLMPKIGDFGLAKINTNNATASSHVAVGTYGYIAPEYGHAYNVTEKSDIYSFGVVLMELVTGRKPLQPEFGEGKTIVGWVWDEMRITNNLISLVDPNISDELKENANDVLDIAISCTSRVPQERPSMRLVIKLLEAVAPPSVPVDIGSGQNQVTSTPDEDAIVPA